MLTGTANAAGTLRGAKAIFQAEVSGNEDVIFFFLSKFMYLPNSIHGQPPSRLRIPTISGTKLGLISAKRYHLFLAL